MMPNRTNQLQAQQAEVDIEIVRALVDILPENWTKAELGLSQTTDVGDSVRIALVIRSPEGFNNAPEPSEELYSAARRLTITIRQIGSILKQADYFMYQESNEDWEFRAKYEYY